MYGSIDGMALRNVMTAMRSNIYFSITLTMVVMVIA
eukprot:SAG31_NODE_1464_length_8235_cov_12.023968_8_plen_36_part_00